MRGRSVNRSWVASNSNDAAFDVKPGCPFEVYSAVTAGARAGFFEAAWWRLTAPPGTVIDRLRLARYGYRFVDAADRPEGGQPQGGWTTGAYVVDNGAVKPIAGEACLVQPGAYLCDFGSKNTSAPVDLDLDATQVTYQVACVREGGTCETESDGFPLAGMTIFNAVATVRDDTPPKVSAGGALLAGGWHRPDEEVSRRRLRRHGHQLGGRERRRGDGRAGDAVRLHADGPVRERQGREDPADRARRRPPAADRHRQGRGRQPGDHDRHDQRRRHGAVRRVAAAVRAHARRQGLRRATRASRAGRSRSTAPRCRRRSPTGG